jgi:hypothetical protein
MTPPNLTVALFLPTSPNLTKRLRTLRKLENDAGRLPLTSSPEKPPPVSSLSRRRLPLPPSHAAAHPLLPCRRPSRPSLPHVKPSAAELRLRRPISGHADLPGELRVSVWSVWTPPPFPSRTAAATVAVAGVVLGAGRAGRCPSRPGQPGRPTWPRAPLSVYAGQVTLGVKCFAQCFYFQKNCCKGLKLVKS